MCALYNQIVPILTRRTYRGALKGPPSTLNPKASRGLDVQNALRFALLERDCFKGKGLTVQGFDFRIWGEGFRVSERLGRFGVCSREKAREKDGYKLAATEDRHGSWNAQA